MRQIRLLLAGAMFVILASSFHVASGWYLVDQSLFSIEFPQKPTSSTQTLNTKLGVLTLENLVYEPSSKKDLNLIYIVTTSNYPDSLINSNKTDILPKFFRGAVDGAVKNAQGELLSEEVIEINGFPGREIRVRLLNGTAISRMQMYLVNNKFFGIQTIAKPENDKNPVSIKFHDSFKLKTKA